MEMYSNRTDLYFFSYLSSKAMEKLKLKMRFQFGNLLNIIFLVCFLFIAIVDIEFPASYMSSKFIHSCFNCMHANSLDEVIIFYDLLPVTCKSNVENILLVATGHLEVCLLVGHCTFNIIFSATIQIVERDKTLRSLKTKTAYYKLKTAISCLN